MMRTSGFAVLACAFFLAVSAPVDAKPVKTTSCGKPFDKTIDGHPYTCTKCTTTTTDCPLDGAAECTITTETTTTCDPKKASSQGGIRGGLGVTPDLGATTLDPGTRPTKRKRLEVAPLDGGGTLAPAE